MANLMQRDWVEYHSKLRPTAAALVRATDRYTISWAELDDRVGRLAGYLKSVGVNVGDRVAVIAENDPRVYEIQFALMRIGGIMVPLNWRLSVVELEVIYRDASPRVILTDDDWLDTASLLASMTGVGKVVSWGLDSGDAAEDYEQVLAESRHVPPELDLPDDTVTHILYTSGTTGVPKGALSTRATLVWQCLNNAQVTRVAEAGAVFLSPLPLFHAGALNTLGNPILYFGGTIFIMKRFEPSTVLAALQDEKLGVTHFVGMTLLFQQMALLPAFELATFPHARSFVIGGGVSSGDLLNAWRNVGVVLQSEYGGTEQGPTAIVFDRDDAIQNWDRALAGSTGRPAMHVEIKLIGPDGNVVRTGETGEIFVRGPAITPGYWNIKSDPFFDGEWYRTGDLAWADADGYYYITGRTSEMYKTGGENVHPSEIELLLAAMPGIADCAVVGVPDERWGEVGILLVVRDQAAAITLEDIHQYLEGHVARYKFPRQLVDTDEIPRSANGKIVRSELRGRIKTPRSMSASAVANEQTQE